MVHISPTAAADGGTSLGAEIEPSWIQNLVISNTEYIRNNENRSAMQELKK
jgi:hypothetical protein